MSVCVMKVSEGSYEQSAMNRMLFTDILIPFIDGFDFINALRINGLTTRFLFLVILNDQKSVQKP